MYSLYVHRSSLSSANTLRLNLHALLVASIGRRAHQWKSGPLHALHHLAVSQSPPILLSRGWLQAGRWLVLASSSPMRSCNRAIARLKNITLLGQLSNTLVQGS